MLNIYKDILRALPDNYTQADMARDFKRTFDTDSGARVLACLWAAASMNNASLVGPNGPISNDTLREREAQRALVIYIMDLATAEAQADGSAETIKHQQQESVKDDGRDTGHRDDFGADGDEWNPVG